MRLYEQFGNTEYQSLSLFQFVQENLLWLNIYLVTLSPGQVSQPAVSTIFKLYSREHPTTGDQSPYSGQTHYEVHFETFCTCFSLHLRIKQLWHIKINQPYIHRGTHRNTQTSSSRAVTQGQRKRFIFIMGKGAKSCWYDGGYINANCIGELLVLEKVCM